jgi:hypothetical protein
VWNGAIDKVTDGFTGMITGSMTVGQALTQIWQGIVTDIIREFVRMAVQWVFLEIFKTSVSASGAVARETIRTGETTSEAAHSAARKGIHLGETIFHGIQMAVRFVQYVTAQVGMTAVTLVQAAIRMPIILLETGKYLIMAAIKAMAAVADIPFVGPILAIAALGAILAVGLKAMGAFADGGMVQRARQRHKRFGDDPGQRWRTCDQGERREYWGEGFMRAINQGAAGARDVQRMALAGMARPVTNDPDALAAMPGLTGSGGRGGDTQVNVAPAPVQVAILNDKSQVLDVLASSAGKAVIVGAVNEARLKLGIQT